MTPYVLIHTAGRARAQHGWGIALALVVMGLAACGPASVSPVGSAPVLTVQSPSTARTTGDTSVPDAAQTFATQGAAAAARASASAAVAAVAAVANVGPPSNMSKDQESKSMPVVGQANDHSAATRDKQTGRK